MEWNGMADMCNYNYALVFRRTWPSSHIACYNDVTIGDHLEALLGWYYVCAHHLQVEMDELSTDIIRMLEQACFNQWAISHFYTM